MRRMAVVLAAAMVVVGCSSSSEPRAVNTSDVPTVSDQERCVGWLTSGDPMTSEQVAGCRNLSVAATQECSDGTQAASVTVDDVTWAMHPGDAAVKTTAADAFSALGALCDA